MFVNQVIKNKSKIAVKDKHCNYSYGEVDQLSDMVAAHLVNITSENQPVGILMERSAKLPIVLLGVLKSGNAYIPLDPKFPRKRLQYITKHSQMKVVIADSKYNQLIDRQIVAQVIAPADLFNNRKISVDALTKVKGADTAYIIYTSGSTGNPKGVEIPHTALSNFLISMIERPGMAKEDLLLSVTTYAFDISILEFFLPLVTGGGVFIADDDTISDPPALIKLIDAERPTVIQATPGFFGMLLKAGWKGDRRIKVLCGGDQLTESLSRELLEKTGELWNMYGPTETTIWSCIKHITKPEDSQLVGKPIHNTQVYVVNSTLDLLPVGATGQLYISGKGLAKGYYQQDQLTEEKFVDNPFNPGTLFYQTGDLACWNDYGEIEFKGRADYQVKLRGYRIEPGEIEKKLTAIPMVTEAVVGVSTHNGADGILIAYYHSEDLRILPEKITAELQKELPEYMVPGIVIQLEFFPQTPNKKVDRKSLFDEPQLYMPEQFQLHTKDYTGAEEKILSFWKQVLETEKNIGINTGFFSLGGQSLKAIELAGLLNTHFHINIKVKDIFDHPTIAAQAVLVEKSARHDQKPIEKVATRESYPLAPVQKTIWLSAQRRETATAYHMSACYEVKGQLDIRRLESAINTVIGKHEILRTAFTEINGVAMQQVKPAAKINFRLEEWSITEGRLQEQVAILCATPFVVEKDLLFRGHVIKLTDGRQYVLFITHHLIVDGKSLELIKDEILTIYNGGYEESATLLQYKEYSNWINELIGDKNVTTEVENYWKSKFAQRKLSPLLVTEGAERVYTGNRDQLHLSNAEQKIFSYLASEIGVSEFSVMLTALSILFHKWKQTEDFCIGVAFEGRVHPDLSKMPGMFVNTLPIICTMDGHDSFRN
ncbi:MAG: non-ribosomal peptide synthetase, partial [Cyclobacteriaceae bacterium]